MAESSLSQVVKKELTDDDDSKLQVSSLSQKVKNEPTDEKGSKMAVPSVFQSVKNEPTDEKESKMPVSFVSHKVKKETVDDEDNEKGTVSEKQLDLPLDKLNLGPKKKLIVLCLGGLLVDRVHVRDMFTVRGLRPDVIYVFKRPFCTEFLNFCFERFEVGLWSSARDHNIDGVLNNITGGMRSKFAFVWGQEDCIDSGFGCIHKKAKPIFLKELKSVWGKTYFKGKYAATNTLIIDDEPHTCLLNPPNTAIFPKPYKKHDPNDTFLGPKGELRKYLDDLVDAIDVPSYVKNHPIGQPAITSENLNWDYYAKIVSRFSKKEDGAESSSKLIGSK